jgi:hypothetical protein
MRHAKHCMGVLGLSVALSGCVASSEIKSDTLSFDDVIEDTTNKLLLLNVLRARDKAPLHFADIPVIRESIQMSASLSATRVAGQVTGTTLRNVATLGGIVQKSPSFEVNHLDSKEFVTGISSPIDAKFVKYWLDRGLDRRIILLLFFSAVEIVEIQSETGPVNSIKVMNSPRDAIDFIRNRKRPYAGPEDLKCDTQSDFERYLKLINVLKTFFAHSYRERRVLARGLSLNEKDGRGLQSFAALDQGKMQLSYDKGTSAYNLYALSPEQKVAFCFYESKRAAGPSASRYEFIDSGATRLRNRKSCYQVVVDAPEEDSTAPEISESPVFFPGAKEVKEASGYCAAYNRFVGQGPAEIGGYPKLELRLHIRSVGEIFQFLGDLLQYQDEVRKYRDSRQPAALKLNTPVTFGYCPDDQSLGCDDIFFRLDGDPSDARFSLWYRERLYSVAHLNPSDEPICEIGGCRERPAGQKDHTLEILSVVHQLVDLNKSATDIRATPFVQVLP